MLRVKVDNQGDVFVGINVSGDDGDKDMYLIKPGDSATIIVEENDKTLAAKTLTQEEADAVNAVKYPPPEEDQPEEEQPAPDAPDLVLSTVEIYSPTEATAQNETGAAYEVGQVFLITDSDAQSIIGDEVTITTVADTHVEFTTSSDWTESGVTYVTLAAA